MVKEFRDFIARGNVVDLAVAVVIGAAFGKIVTALVEGVLMPPLGLLLGRVDFSSLFLVLDPNAARPASLAAAKAAGVPVIAYGAFLNEIVNFLIVGFAIFLLVKQANRFKAPTAVTKRRVPEVSFDDSNRRATVLRVLFGSEEARITGSRPDAASRYVIKSRSEDPTRPAGSLPACSSRSDRTRPPAPRAAFRNTSRNRMPSSPACTTISVAAIEQHEAID